MRCQDIMEKDVECVSPRDTVEDAAIRMRDEDIGFLPVCDDSRQVLGTLTDRDVVVRLVAARKPASGMVEEIMTKEVVSCRPEDDVREAQQAMARSQKSRIVCVDADGRLAGVISLADIAKHQGGGDTGQTLRDVKQP
jgi:CBS domain-containing protein